MPEGQTHQSRFSFLSPEKHPRGVQRVTENMPSGNSSPSPTPESGQRNGGPHSPPAYGRGVFLTWKDLCVLSLESKCGGQVPILYGLNGIARPGEVLAIMGPSGCGKSTLLDALAGRLASNLWRTGELRLNGRKQRLAFDTSAYVMQKDVLMTTLTVREAVHYAAELQLRTTMGRAAREERAEETLRVMGLSRIAGMRIGGRSSKGISGGQRRRVSICLEILARPRLLFLDEPSSGLDSAAAFHVMGRIARMAARERMTVVAAVHQPTAEVFDLFHSVCLLAYGRAVFFGSPVLAEQFFAENGFPCPSLKNPSDHFLRTINKDFEMDNEDLEAGKMTTSEAIEILVESYRSSISKLQVLEIAKLHEVGGDLVKQGKKAGFLMQFLVLTERSFMNMFRDFGYYWLRFAIYVVLCLCIGTIYHGIGQNYSSIQVKSSMLIFITAFLTFMAIGGFPSFVEDMKIFKRERLNGHYGVTAFVAANTVSSIPFLALISIVPGAIAYYLVGLQSSIHHFAYFALVLLACMMLVEGLMMIVAGIVPDFLMGIITGAGIQGVMMLNGGLFRLPGDLPALLWRYPMYYVSFHKYAVQGFYKNEFIGQSFLESQTIGGLPAMSTGKEILVKMFQVEMSYSKWVDLAILLGMVVLYRIIFIVILKASVKVKIVLREMMIGVSKQSIAIAKLPD